MERYFTALLNPRSVLYTRQLKDAPGTKANSYYGLVCSMYVSYVLDLPYRVVCKDWPSLSTVHLVNIDPLENLRLCDILLEPKSHIAIITDIQRDADGKIHWIEVSESTLPLTVRNTFTPEEFRHFWLDEGYSVWRYDLLDTITYTPNPYIPLPGDPELPVPAVDRALMLDFGNRANYRIGDEPVELSVFETDWEHLEVTAPDGSITAYPAADLVLQPTVPGRYRACLVRGDERSIGVEWCMVNISLSFDGQHHDAGESVTCHFTNAAADDVFYMTLNTDTYYVQGGYLLTAEERAAGCACLPPIEKPGKYMVIVLAKNEFGIYSSPYTRLIVE